MEKQTTLSSLDAPTCSPVIFDHRVWKNWEGGTLEAVEMLNAMLKKHGLKINVDWDWPNDYTEVSILKENALFCQEYLGRPWEPTPEEKRLRELAAQYHEETESYDRTVCTGPIRNGAIMPMGSGEHAAINRNALAVRERLGAEVAELGFTKKEWQHAIANFRQND
jgi:hypothetical protein